MIKLTYEKNIHEGEIDRAARWVLENTENEAETKYFYLVKRQKGARKAAKEEAVEFARKVYGQEVSGRAYPRCGAKCQFAVCEECKCGCEGKNHGAGRRV